MLRLSGGVSKTRAPGAAKGRGERPIKTPALLWITVR